MAAQHIHKYNPIMIGINGSLRFARHSQVRHCRFVWRRLGISYPRSLSDKRVGAWLTASNIYTPKQTIQYGQTPRRHRAALMPI